MMCIWLNLIILYLTTDATILYLRILKSDNTADTTANYDRAFKALRTDTTFS
jgi:hypothetical protein